MDPFHSETRCDPDVFRYYKAGIIEYTPLSKVLNPACAPSLYEAYTNLYYINLYLYKLTLKMLTYININSQKCLEGL